MERHRGDELRRCLEDAHRLWLTPLRFREREVWLGAISRDIATTDRPHRNLMNAPYWTDGKREVFLFDDEPTSA